MQWFFLFFLTAFILTSFIWHVNSPLNKSDPINTYGRVL